MLFDRPASLPTATMRSTSRLATLASQLRGARMNGWQWLRPRMVPAAVAIIGMLAVLGSAEYLTHLARYTPEQPAAIIVESTPCCWHGGRARLVVQGQDRPAAPHRHSPRRVLRDDPARPDALIAMSIRRVHHLNCATMCPVAGYLLGRNAARGHMVAHCLLVETDRDGLVLIDTGFGTRDVQGQTPLSSSFKTFVGPRLEHAETALAQVIRLGFRADEVRHVVVTHLDLDHAGGLVDFPAARVHLHAREHAAAMARKHFKERERYLAAHWSHGPKWEVYREDGDTWRGLPAIARLRGVDADIGLLPLHGHTRGHSGVIVRAKDRWLVHAGDAYFHHGTIDGTGTPFGFAMFERMTQMDAAQRRASLGALRQLCHSHSDVDLFSAHDPVEYEALRARTN